ncbi:SpvB/TcaC N-terminal domain-containing protein [Hymenobacter sp. ASUV-10]|uniref:SpvB/TcaC N-terminal domain-containing protein n=1 Tax=Hymenobacter aranciens TaxID=3063996 RepID=A0ABT9BHK1_9BACT|nr:SpvB/TcaC N-terminal domain-containing protein [Hymenobacter sp. ASUV-10]MDO7877730.1 SpvB/TcaC N-terminal domain-containing protein [Hymenobacter sp. ASUV-10]
MSNTSGASAISLPKGGGAVGGLGEKFSPDLFTGTGNFSVPIALPPGRNGFQPELTLGYSTGNGNSAFGLGWNLSVPGVTRKTSKGIPRYDDDQDVFILSGAEDLVPIVRKKLTEVGRTGHKVQYRPRTEGLFARIEHYRYHDDAQQYYDYWLVWSKDGLRSFYGSETVPVLEREGGQPAANPDNQAIIADPLHPGNIFAWHLTRTVDLFGNDILYDYTRERATTGVHQYEQTYLRRIRYVDYGNATPSAPKKYLVSAEFDYETRPDPFSDYGSGFEQRTTQRCTAIRTLTHPEVADRPMPNPHEYPGYTHIDAANPHGYVGAPSRVTVKTYALTYVDRAPAQPQPLNGVSLLHQVQVMGYDLTAVDEDDRTEQMPPLEFGYSTFAPLLQRFFPVEGELPSTSLANPELELIDVFGHGLPDIVQLGGGVARYWKNLGNGRFDLPRSMPNAPGGLHLADPDVQLLDANGNGTADLLVNRDGLSGYFPLRFTGLWDKKAFHKYKQRPSFSFADPEVKLLDLDGDGVTDVLRNGSRFEYFYNDPEQGFGEVQQVNKSTLEDFPAVSFQDPRVRLARLCNGLQALCMVHSGRIEYWPNLGRGRWGQRIAMRNSPVLPRGYNPAHVFFGDVDGDGLDDCLYIQNNKLTLWLNQSGNGWSAPLEITGTPPLTDASSVRITDLLGTGVAGVLWTRDATAVGRAQQYLFLDLTGRVKPYVLNQMDNQMGALTRVGYAPSTKYYVADAQRPATRWRTPLPFPVQVVSHVEVVDQISGGKMTTEYSYHHGYWDGGEREFRGFGRVDQRDTQSFEDYNSAGLLATTTGLPLVPLPGDFDAADFSPVDFETGPVLGVPPRTNLPVAAEYYSPPLETRTWFHLGPVGDEFGEWEELDLSNEYWQEVDLTILPANGQKVPLMQRPAGMTDLIRSLPRRHRRDAFRTLRGSTLRTELYALDGTARQDRPYTVTESLTGVAQVLRVQPDSGDVVLAFAPPSTTPARQPERPIFFAHGLAQRTTQWERGTDPMTQVSYTGDYDNYGQARRQLSVALPRTWNRTQPVTDALVSVSISQYAGYATTTMASRNTYDRADLYLVDRGSESTSYEVKPTGLLLPDLVARALNPAQFATLAVALLGRSRQYYDGDAFQGRSIGELGSYGALTRSEVLLLTSDLLTRAYGGTPLLLQKPLVWTSDYPQAFRDAYQATYPQGRAGYHVETLTINGQEVNHYYQNTERRQYDFQLSPVPAVARGLVQAMLDPLAQVAAGGAPQTRVSRVSYDGYALLPVTTTDALGHQTTARYDYRVLQARLVTDPNLNRTAYGFSPLGLLYKTGILGKFGANEGDVKVEAASSAAVPDYVPSTTLTYNFHAFTDGRRQPCWVQTTQRETHWHPLDTRTDDTLVKREYSDGFGRLLQTRSQAEDVLFGDAAFGDSGLPATAGLPNAPAVGRRVAAGHFHVVVSGWQVYDNKGQVVEKYEPFFSQDFAFVAAEAAARGQRTRLYYNPRGQAIRTLNPDGTEQRVVHGTPGPRGQHYLEEFLPSAWETYTYDANDLAELTHPAGAPGTAAAHRYTPQSARFDALGRVVQTIDRLEATTPGGPLKEVVMQFWYDLRGNRTRVQDALGRDSFIHHYDLRPKGGEDDPGANILYTQHLDGGTQYLLYDGAGQPLHSWHLQRGTLQLQAYDELGRLADAWTRDQAGERTTRRQRLVYGTDPATNLVGQVARHYDEAGLLTVTACDFKGNVLDKVRRVVRDEDLTAAWASGAAAGWTALPADTNAHWDALAQPAADPNWETPAQARLAPRSYQTTAQYDALNRPTRMTLPAEPGRSESRAVLLPSYNRAGSLAQAALDGQLLVAHVAYNAKGQRLLLARGNGLLTRYAYDRVNFRLRRLRTEKYTATGDTLTPLSGSTRQDTSYAYDLAGNIVGMTERGTGRGVQGDDLLTREFAYDALYRLLEATGRENQPTPGRPWQESTRTEGVDSTRFYRQFYQYDKLGNIAQLQHVGQNSFTRTFSYVAGRNYLQEVSFGTGPAVQYVHDKAGNIARENGSRHLGWDGANQLRQYANWTGPTPTHTAPTVLAQYLYDAGGQRTKKLVQTSAGTWQVTVYVDGGFEHRYEVSSSTISAEQTTLAVLDGQSRLYQRRSGDALGDQRPAELYPLADHLGSTAGQTDASGGEVSREEYYPFGETSFSGYARQRFRFCGKELDEESGFYYYGMRYYAPWICRFVSVDPLAAKYTYYTPYQYAGNKPINFTDLDGAEEQRATNSGGKAQGTQNLRPSTATVQDQTKPLSQHRSVKSTAQKPAAHNTSLANKLASYRNSAANDAIISQAPSSQLQAEFNKQAGYDAAMKAGAGTDPLMAGGEPNNPNGMVATNFAAAREVPLFLLTEGASIGVEMLYTAWVLRGARVASTAERVGALSLEVGASTSRSLGPIAATTEVFTKAAPQTVETFYRSMTAEAYEILMKTGKMPAGTETFLSRTSEYAATYDGVLVEFKLNPGTVAEFEKIGVRNAAVKNPYKSMPLVGENWKTSNAFFKFEGHQVNIGLGNGKALEIFNSNISSFRRIN